MKALVVYDSVFGNTEKVAQAIGAALGPPEEVEVLGVTDANPEQVRGLDLLVVGSPTRAFKATGATNKLLKSLPKGSLRGVKVAAFDTRMPMGENVPGILRVLAKVFGYAAEPIGDRLNKRGGQQLAPPEGFFVNDSEGPLREGELDRATEWAKQILAKV